MNTFTSIFHEEVIPVNEKESLKDKTKRKIEQDRAEDKRQEMKDRLMKDRGHTSAENRDDDVRSRKYKGDYKHDSSTSDRTNGKRNNDSWKEGRKEYAKEKRSVDNVVQKPGPLDKKFNESFLLDIELD